MRQRSSRRRGTTPNFSGSVGAAGGTRRGSQECDDGDAMTADLLSDTTEDTDG